MIDPPLIAAARQFGTPAYIYSADIMAQRLHQLQAAFGRWFDISFAVKSNPNPQLLGWLRARIGTLDISSQGEFQLAVQAGWDPERLSFTGPAKRRAELEQVITAGLGELIVESLREARLANEIAAACGKVQPVLIRLGPDHVPKGFGDHMAGRPTPFGIDIEEADQAVAEILNLAHLRLDGFHIYSGTQSLKAQAICENWRGFIGIFQRMITDHGIRPKRLIFGAGLGIPYHLGDQALDIDAISQDIAPDLDAFRSLDALSDCSFALELGRYLVGPAGFFVTEVISTKTSRGGRIAICDGGMNANLAASGNFGMVLRRNYIMHRLGDAAGLPEEKQDITGPLCTSIDKLGSGVMLPTLLEGDLIAIHNCGAYGPSASPLNFISHPHPKEIWLEDDQAFDITRL